MFDAATTLALLQYGDSAYPAGGFAFSWGIEGLAQDGLLSGQAGLDDLVFDHLTFRWNTMDRPLLVRACKASNLAAVAAIDRYIEAATVSAEMRVGSHRAGRALLSVSSRLGGPLSSGYRAIMAGDQRLGHLPVAQALVYRDGGLGLEESQLLSGWTLVTGLVSAGVRLGVIGHVEAQRSMASARGTLAELIASDLPDKAQPSSFTPLIDIAVCRGPSRHVRMFST
ncbi:MAG: urease accessory UreF family protein [Rhizobium sp.]|uniref:urease accessory protein UreF n=1 Tax=Rhizobium sp. SYY.PMSO TaxID=3382192 RepID=UPI0039902AC2